MAIVIKPNGEKTVAHPKNERTGFDLEEIYALIGCDCIDVVRLADGALMVCDDEACYKTEEACPPNQMASALYWASRPHALGYPIRGTVLIGSRKEIQ